MIDYIKCLRIAPWIIAVVLAAVLGAFIPIWPNGQGGFTVMTGYVLSWFGGMFKASSGAILGWYFVRKVFKLDLSEIFDPKAQALAGLGAAIVVAAFVIAVSVAL